MDVIAVIIIGPILVAYGILVFNGKLLWFLASYKYRFKDETDENYKKKVYRTYGIIFMIIGIVTLIVGLILFSKGIISTKKGFLY